MIDILKKIIPGDFCTGCFSGLYNYINPLNIQGKPYRYAKWLDEFIRLNGVEMPEMKEEEEVLLKEQAGGGEST
ncbi:MAG: hypothetical protein A2Z21_08850 [Candidatus Fraserbacteria bacterium RBG_16_55_9]|uniref:Uncharacterized protein n=1 Tax=Fraserbacteria sp. (strain RBG_16_55_9) TaxID=1817864 RepID=A0A1F5V0C5_FRAXR|nr:MAG: hypothetical protein A2Z21_08850 [Candidatus Fraserbacteria bacterium RBG_16_55_9]